ncbi:MULTISPECIES: NepR family anti-sigma factor [unclassified Brevundimonas]|uniref:anti-sigma T factor NepR n=1 Tax=unclassified Brevundimonas TaxID=2622653 RepID=UPI00130505DB|nr:MULTISPECIES: NepR family anti-sigma factor [unclassified Brevundimonas]
MMNAKETTPRPDAPASRDHGLEEVRLRQQAIGVKLRHMFDQVVNEPVPDEFLDILRRADERSSTKEGQ